MLWLSDELKAGTLIPGSVLWPHKESLLWEICLHRKVLKSTKQEPSVQWIYLTDFRSISGFMFGVKVREMSHDWVRRCRFVLSGSWSIFQSTARCFSVVPIGPIRSIKHRPSRRRIRSIPVFSCYENELDITRGRINEPRDFDRPRGSSDQWKAQLRGTSRGKLQRNMESGLWSRMGQEGGPSGLSHAWISWCAALHQRVSQCFFKFPCQLWTLENGSRKFYCENCPFFTVSTHSHDAWLRSDSILRGILYNKSKGIINAKRWRISGEHR